MHANITRAFDAASKGASPSLYLPADTEACMAAAVKPPKHPYLVERLTAGDWMDWKALAETAQRKGAFSGIRGKQFICFEKVSQWLDAMYWRFITMSCCHDHSNF